MSLKEGPKMAKHIYPKGFETIKKVTIEAIIVGATLSFVVYIVDTLSRYYPALKMDRYTYMFVIGIIIHVLYELLGLNALYVSINK